MKRLKKILTILMLLTISMGIVACSGGNKKVLKVANQEDTKKEIETKKIRINASSLSFLMQNFLDNQCEWTTVPWAVSAAAIFKPCFFGKADTRTVQKHFTTQLGAKIHSRSRRSGSFDAEQGMRRTHGQA